MQGKVVMPNSDPSKWVQAADVARIAFFLASDGAAQINGAVIPVCGHDV